MTAAFLLGGLTDIKSDIGLRSRENSKRILYSYDGVLLVNMQHLNIMMPIPAEGRATPKDVDLR